MRFIISLILCCFSIQLIIGQDVNNKIIADQYFIQAEYTKALELYTKAFKKNKTDFEVYSRILECYIILEDLSTADKHVKKFYKNSNDNLFNIDYGYILLLSNKNKLSDKFFNNVIDILNDNDIEIRRIAKRFKFFNQNSWAIKTYNKGNKLLDNKLQFINQLRDLYLLTKNIPAYIDASLTILNYYPEERSIIENGFQVNLSESELNLLNKKIITFLQKEPGNSRIGDIYIWFCIYTAQYNNAFIQVKAMGKRKKDGGRQLLEFSKVMIKEQEYELAKKCLNEVIKIGNSYYSQKAQKQRLEIDLKLLNEDYFNELNLINDIIKAFDEYILIASKEDEKYWAELHKARIYAFKLHQFKTAETILEDLAKKSIYKKEYQIESKLSLGDISLFSGDPWTAILLYSQIEKAYENTPKADLAKYKTALVSFYLGDFEWSQAQLDAIKGSTSKLISNDAISLSSFIQNNYGLDSVETPLKWFSQAKLFEYQKDHKKCRLYLDSLERFYSGHTLIDDAYLLRSELFKKEKNFKEEVKFLTKVMNEYPYDLLADKAIYRLAQIQELHYKDREKAYKLYEKIILEYSDSLYVIQSRKKYRKLKSNLLKDDRI